MQQKYSIETLTIPVVIDKEMEIDGASFASLF